jgi:hypothetical protein
MAKPPIIPGQTHEQDCVRACEGLNPLMVPELIIRLREVVEAFKSSPDPTRALDRARAAIARAETLQ